MSLPMLTYLVYFLCADLGRARPAERFAGAGPRGELLCFDWGRAADAGALLGAGCRA